MADANKFSSPHQEPDEISLFLQQILLRSSSSSSSSSSSFMRQHYSLSDHLHLLPEQQEAEMGGISVPDPFSTCSFTGRAVANVSSSSVGNLDNEPDECDYESELPCLDADDAIMVLSEEAVEALVEATVPKPRSSSKRSRAAEVHNLSEKRRRSRINEKMKALQNLIPNSNKTDKASMLDEAIEYLKQLQLQVQMLTMRNGLSLYPVCLPGMLQPNQISQMRMGICDTDKFVNVNMTKANCTEQNISADVLLRPQENCVKMAPAADFSTAIGLKTSLEEESSIQKQHFGAFQLSKSSKGICQKALPAQSLIEDCPQSSSAGAKAFPSETQKSNLKENILEVRLAGGDHLLPNYANNPIFSSHN